MAENPVYRTLNRLVFAMAEAYNYQFVISHHRTRALPNHYGYKFRSKKCTLHLSAERKGQARVSFCKALLNENEATSGTVFKNLCFSDEV